MNVQVEKQENNMAVLTVEVDAAAWDKAIEGVYRKMRGRINVPGFRKGKAPRKMIEKLYGASIFFEDAANQVIDDTYSDAAEESGEDIVSFPDFEVIQIEADKPLIYTARVALRPPVKLGKYKGIAVEPIDDTVTDEELDGEIEHQRDLNSRMVDVTDRPVQDGDNITLDFDGYIDGKRFDGGKAENHSLRIGSGAFIPGFEEQLVGAEIEQPVSVTVTFPDDYHEESLRGREAVFKCIVHTIREKQLPELDDDYASDYSEFETFAEYKEDMKKKLSDRKRETGERERENKVLAEIVADSDIELPEAMVESNIAMTLRDTERNLRMQGLTLQQYAQYTGQSVEGIREQLKPDVEKRLKGSLALSEIAKQEGLTLSDEEFEEELKRIADDYHMEPDKYRERLTNGQLKEIRENAAIERALKYVVEQAKEKKEKK